MIESYTSKPPRVTIINMRTNATLEAMFNPAEFEETVGAEFARQVVPGLSHEVTQFSHTKNRAISVRFYYNTTNSGPSGYEQMLTARRFLLALTHPVEGQTSSVVGSGTPRALFVWPGLLSITCYVTEVRVEYTRFNKDATPCECTFTLALEEVRDALVSSEDIMAGETRTSGVKRWTPGKDL